MNDKSKGLTTLTGTDLQNSLDKIWRETEWLNAQVPAGLRKAIGAIQSIQDPAKREQQFQAFVLGQLMDVRSSMTNEDSKFGHLVAGTEAIVKTLQNINPLMRRLDSVESGMNSLMEMMERINDKLNKLGAVAPPVKVKPTKPEERYDESEPSDEPAIEDKLADESRKGTIGSAWAK
jgi:hypothetical protein